MIRKPLILAGLAVALLATPAFAQSSAPSAVGSDPSAAQAQPPQGSVSAPGSMGAQPAAPNNTTDQAPSKSPYSQGSSAKPSVAGGSNGGNVPVNKNASSGSSVTNSANMGTKTKHASTSTHHKQATNCYNYAYQSAQMNNCLAHNQTAGMNGMGGSSGTTGNTGKTLMQNGNRGTAPSENNPNGKGATVQ
jgi:hypothetical protein